METNNFNVKQNEIDAIIEEQTRHCVKSEKVTDSKVTEEENFGKELTFQVNVGE